MGLRAWVFHTGGLPPLRPFWRIDEVGGGERSGLKGFLHVLFVSSIRGLVAVEMLARGLGAASNDDRLPLPQLISEEARE